MQVFLTDGVEMKLFKSHHIYKKDPKSLFCWNFRNISLYLDAGEPSRRRQDSGTSSLTNNNNNKVYYQLIYIIKLK